MLLIDCQVLILHWDPDDLIEMRMPKVSEVGEVMPERVEFYWIVFRPVALSLGLSE